MNTEELKLLQSIASDIKELKSDVTELKDRVAGVELILENETNKSIRFLSEGHGGLSAKVNNMRADVEEIKESVSILKFVQNAMAKQV